MGSTRRDLVRQKKDAANRWAREAKAMTWTVWHALYVRWQRTNVNGRMYNWEKKNRQKTIDRARQYDFKMNERISPKCKFKCQMRVCVCMCMDMCMWFFRSNQKRSPECDGWLESRVWPVDLKDTTTVNLKITAETHENGSNTGQERKEKNWERQKHLNIAIELLLCVYLVKEKVKMNEEVWVDLYGWIAKSRPTVRAVSKKNRRGEQKSRSRLWIRPVHCQIGCKKAPRCKKTRCKNEMAKKGKKGRADVEKRLALLCRRWVDLVFA